MSYLVLARKWRPQTFEEVVGQEATTRALATALATGRVAHAFLFTGPRGVGKTTAARILAKALNCERGPGPTPCNACALCEEVTTGRSVDVLEIDGASNTGVDDVRDLREKVKYAPARARHKVIIIDEVHMLSASAFNALLKTLEEPPPQVIFVFATTEPHKIPATVLSRVQRYDFRRIPFARVLGRLEEICRAEGVEAQGGALALVAREADGSLRDALSLLDQVLGASGGAAMGEAEVADALGVVDRGTLVRLCRALLEGDPAGCLSTFEQVFVRGHDMRHFAGALLELLRDLAVAKVVGERVSFDRPDHEVREVRALVEPHGAAALYRLFDTLARAFDEIARSPYPKLLLEMTLLRMATAEPLEPVAEAIAKLEALERRLGTARIEAPRVRAEAPRVAAVPTRPESRPDPAPAAPEAPPAAAAAPPGEPAAGWRTVIERLRERRRPLAAVYEQGRLLAFGTEEVRIAFVEIFLLEKARDPEGLRVVADLCREQLGAGVPVNVVPYEGDPNAAPASLAEESRRRDAEARDRRRRDLAEHPNVQAAQEVLGARLVDVRVEGKDE